MGWGHGVPCPFLFFYFKITCAFWTFEKTLKKNSKKHHFVKC